MIGISKLDFLDSALREEVDGLVAEGNTLSYDAGKGLSRDTVEQYLKRCKDVRLECLKVGALSAVG